MLAEWQCEKSVKRAVVVGVTTGLAAAALGGRLAREANAIRRMACVAFVGGDVVGGEARRRVGEGQSGAWRARRLAAWSARALASRNALPREASRTAAGGGIVYHISRLCGWRISDNASID